LNNTIDVISVVFLVNVRYFAGHKNKRRSQLWGPIFEKILRRAYEKLRMSM